LKTDPNSADLRNIQGILLDPSCSGSGTAATRMDLLLPLSRTKSKQSASEQSTSELEVAFTSGNHEFPGRTSDASSRVAALAAFQTKALLHALSFPCALRVVYSTCSVYREENEDVVAKVLPDAEKRGFRLACALPGWKRRGLREFPWADAVVRVHPELDCADGFFVAVFEREDVFS
jgi:25S rRNA (cytosine2278-C5)-methyltransferase